MVNALVTGANGFIGSNLVAALLARGDRVRGLVRPASRLDLLDVTDIELVHGDVADPESVRRAATGVDVVYHVAGCVRALRRERFLEINEQGVRHVASACAEQPNPPVLILVSSLAACGPSRRGRPRVETDPPEPVSTYGLSKRAGELAARRWANEVPITVVRPAIVLGLGDRAGLAMFRSVFRFRVHAMPRYGHDRFSVIDARDLAKLLILVAERGARVTVEENDPDTQTPNGRGCYFVACLETPTYAELGRMIGQASRRRVTVPIPIPMPGVRGCAAVGDLLGKTMGRPVYSNPDKAREIAAGSWTCSPRNAARELGFTVGTPLAKRLRQTVHWYRRHGWL